MQASHAQNQSVQTQQPRLDSPQKFKVAIIGSGFGGLAAAIKLLKSGIDDFIILEKADDVGGTWRENQYPGAACDVQSHMYSLSYAPKTDWSKRYAEAPEIFQYIQNLIQDFQLKPFIRFNQEVTSTRYDENLCQWQVETKKKAQQSKPNF